MVDSMDVAIGQVIEAFEAKGMRDNTLAMFTSDNGGRSDRRNGELCGGKKTLFEGGIRVPTRSIGPASRRGKKITEASI